MRDSVKVIEETEKDFAKRFGRKYGFTEDYRCDDADVIVIALGHSWQRSGSGHRSAPERGHKGRLDAHRWLRPFPKLNLKGKEVVVIDRDYSFGRGGILCRTEIRAQDRHQPL
jgi:pyruvate ferredoxin oxidoreductase alpha subunit